jgi:hypothetical protein
MPRSKNAIALLITVMFVIVITVAIGLGLKQVNVASQEVKNENFMYQSSIIIEDVLKILKSSPDLKRVVDGNSSSDFFTFLSQASYIPFSSSGIDIILQVSSARGKFNPKQLDIPSSDIMREYFANNRINSEYMNLLLDSVSGIKVDNSYNSAIFNEHPYLFRDYIASTKHLKVINDFYAKEYNDNALKNIDFEKLFYFSDSNDTKIDLNYATPEVWEMMAGVNKERASELNAAGGFYETMEDVGLDDTERQRVENFKVSFYEPYLLVNVEIIQDKSKAKISFEYDIRNNKGSNFVYEI